MDINSIRVLIKGGGDLASGVAYRLYMSGFPLLIVEKEKPLAVRRKVAYASAIYEEEVEIEGITAKYVSDLKQVRKLQLDDQIPVTTLDDYKKFSHRYENDIFIDGRMLKERPDDIRNDLASLVIGLGPGFTAGENVDVAIETCRGHFLGRAIYDGSTQPYSGKPGKIEGVREKRVIHSPTSGKFVSDQEIGNMVNCGEKIGRVGEITLETEVKGVIRGMIKPGISVKQGTKLADIDPRGQKSYVNYISDKALAVGGGVLEAVFNKFSGRFQNED